MFFCFRLQIVLDDILLLTFCCYLRLKVVVISDQGVYVFCFRLQIFYDGILLLTVKFRCCYFRLKFVVIQTTRCWSTTGSWTLSSQTPSPPTWCTTSTGREKRDSRRYSTVPSLVFKKGPEADFKLLTLHMYFFLRGLQIRSSHQKKALIGKLSPGILKIKSLEKKTFEMYLFISLLTIIYLLGRTETVENKIWIRDYIK